MGTQGGSRRAWTLGLVTGALFTAGLVVLEATVVWPDGPWWVVALTGIGAGVFFGAVMGPTMARAERATWRACAEDLTWPEFKAAAKASRSGRVPADPRLHAAATRIAAYQLAQHQRRHRSTIIGCSVLVGFSLLSAVVGNLLALFAAGAIAVVLAVFLYERVRLRNALLRLGLTRS